MLIQYTSSDGKPLLHSAVVGGHVKLAKMLIEQGANKEATVSLTTVGTLPVTKACSVP